MNSKYLTPYRPSNIGEESYIRNFLGSSTNGFAVWKNYSSDYWSYVHSNGMYNIIKKTNSLRNAKRWLDESLIENSYILLTEEQVQKLQLLC
jgi:hypothetical protein